MKKILIVEDDQIVANIYRNKFSVDGFQVEIALDGQVGLEMIPFIPTRCRRDGPHAAKTHRR